MDLQVGKSCQISPVRFLLTTANLFHNSPFLYKPIKLCFKCLSFDQFDPCQILYIGGTIWATEKKTPTFHWILAGL